MKYIIKEYLNYSEVRQVSNNFKDFNDNSFTIYNSKRSAQSEANYRNKRNCPAVLKIKRLALKLNRLYCNNCNGFENEMLESRNDIAIKKTENKIKELASELNLYLYLQTDPRGDSVKLSDQEMNGSDYSSKAILSF